MSSRAEQIYFDSNSRGAPRWWRMTKPSGNGGGFRNKPDTGGLWTSTYQDNGWLCDWHEQGVMMFGNLGPIYLLSIARKVKLRVIDTYADLEKFINEYAKPVTRFAHMVWANIDFPKIFEDYDGIRLTEEGQWNTRLTEPLSLYGWDSETTLWGHWVFKIPREITNSSIGRRAMKIEEENKFDY